MNDFDLYLMQQRDVYLNQYLDFQEHLNASNDASLYLEQFK